MNFVVFFRISLTKSLAMYLLTEWEGRKIFGPRSWRNGLRAKYFPVWFDLNSVNKHFIIWALYTIHEHSEFQI